MKNLTTKEKSILIDALDHYALYIDQARQGLASEDKNEVTLYFWEIEAFLKKMKASMK
jgi:hypothetical protein